MEYSEVMRASDINIRLNLYREIDSHALIFLNYKM